MAAPIAIARPLPDEFAAGSAGYIARAPLVSHAVRQLEVQRDALVAFLSPLSDAAAGYRYAPEKWSIRDLIAHMSDTERVLGYRLMRIGRGDDTPLPGFEESDYARAAAADRRPVADLLDEWVAVRNATQALVRGMPVTAWAQRGVANGHPVTAGALLYIILGHVEHHRHILEERYGVGANGVR